MTIFVRMGYTGIIKYGVTGDLDSGAMEFSSAFVGEVSRDGEKLCSIMCHRGVESRFTFSQAVRAALSEYLPISDLTVNPVAIQSGPYPCVLLSDKAKYFLDLTDVRGYHDRTDTELVKSMHYIFGIDEDTMYDMIEDGPGINSTTNRCTGCVNILGDVLVPKRQGMFELCACGNSIEQEIKPKRKFQ